MYMTFSLLGLLSVAAMASADNPHVARQGVASPAPAPPSPGPSFVFRIISPMTSCNPASMFWIYTGPTFNFSLTITNQGVAQVPPATLSARSPFIAPIFPVRAVPTGAAGSQDSITVDIVDDLNPNQGNYTWPQVNVPQGSYIMLATSSPSSPYNLNVQSAPFAVSNGTDVSCIAPILPPPSSSSSQSSSATVSPSSSSTDVPSTGSSSSKSSTAAIAGGVVGGFILLTGLIGAILFHRAANRPAFSLRSGSGLSRKWGGLGSVDSRFGSPKKRSGSTKSNGSAKGSSRSYGRSQHYNPDNVVAINPRHHSQPDSFGPILAHYQSSVPSVRDEGEANSLGVLSASEEKFNNLSSPPTLTYGSPFTDPEQAHLQGGHNDIVYPYPKTNSNSHASQISGITRRSSLSSQGHGNASSNNAVSSTANTSAVTTTTTVSGSNNNDGPTSKNHPRTPQFTPTVDVNLARRASMDYPPTSFVNVGSGVGATTSLPAAVEGGGVVRSGSYGGGLGTGERKKTPRKPVPTYRGTDSDKNIVGKEAPVENSGAETELSRKASYGDGRKMHYLIPDMPPFGGNE